MFPVMQNPIGNKNFCWGRFETTVDDASRIRLNKGIVTALKAQKVQQLWRFPNPTSTGLIICPPQNKLTYVRAAKANFPKEIDAEVAYRKYICPGEPAPFDEQGRLSLTAACLEHSKIKSGHQIMILGIGQWYELWRWDDWLRNVHQACGRRSNSSPSGSKV